MAAGDPYGYNALFDSPLLSMIASHPTLPTQGAIQQTQPQSQPQSPQDQSHFGIGHAIGSAISSMLGVNSPQGEAPLQSQAQPDQSQGASPVTVPNHSLTGILGIGGTPGKLINWLGDTIATAAGMRLPFADDPQKRAEAAAMSNFSNDPSGAVQKLASTGDTQGALGLHNSLVNQQMVAQQRQMQLGNYQSLEAQRQQNVQATFLKRSGASLNGIDKLDPSVQDATYQARRQNIYTAGAQAGLTPEQIDAELQLPDKYDAGKLDPAINYGTPVVRLDQAGSARIAADARAQQANNGSALVPSEIARNLGQAGAAGVNAHAHAQQAAAAASNAGVNKGTHTDANGNYIPVNAPKQRRAPPTETYPTISASALPSGARTGMLGNRRVAQVKGQTFFVGP